MSKSPVVPPGLKSTPAAAPGSAARPDGPKKHAGYTGVHSEEEDDAEDEENAGKPPAVFPERDELKADRLRRLRKIRQQKVAMKWTLSDPVMGQYANMPRRDTNLYKARTAPEIAYADKVAAHWKFLVDQKVFLPKNEHATWFNMPDEAKVWSFLQMIEAGLDISPEEYNDKASARLSKLRGNKPHRSFRTDPKHQKFVNTHPLDLWTAFRDDVEEEEEPEAVDHGLADKYTAAQAEIALLKSQLAGTASRQLAAHCLSRCSCL